ncbi:hypothetical protein PHYPSEUDO_012232 [Phytophthora pseudosyringae]|uniref:Uncharacterized protein n=1 Tax=Phytophthora pseudosyringae TaxID=221518 RepID=A0A8T1VC01_9STRA|nr:hypothetical protein PHYPSEUDO_012232 [Phytophthora pseudosyringae]
MEPFTCGWCPTRAVLPPIDLSDLGLHFSGVPAARRSSHGTPSRLPQVRGAAGRAPMAQTPRPIGTARPGLTERELDRREKSVALVAVMMGPVPQPPPPPLHADASPLDAFEAKGRK